MDNSKSKKLAIVVTSIEGFGGLERSVSELSNIFISKKYCEVSIVALVKGHPNYAIPKEVLLYTPEFDYKNHTKVIAALKTFFYLRKMIELIEPNSILCFGENANIFTLISLFKMNHRVFVSDRSSPQKNISMGFFMKLIKKYLYSQSTGIICQTKDSKKILESLVKHKRMYVIPNIIKIFSNGEETLKRKNIILSVGRFIPSKHHDRLIKIFSKTGADDWQLIIIGEGPEKSRLENLISNLNLSNRVSLIPPNNNLGKYFSIAKIFCFTSSAEGFPNALGEAFLFPVASISYDCIAGPNSIIINGINGFLVKLFDDQDYLEKLKLLINNDSLREEFETEAVKFRDNYTPQTIGRLFYNILFDEYIR